MKRMIAAVALLASASPAAAAPDWDRVDNIKTVARVIGEIQARQGSDRAFQFIAACYKTHGLSSKYSKAIEGCIAQDFMLMEVLARIYSRVDPDVLKKQGAPSVETIVHALNRRVGGTLAQYELKASDGQALKTLVDTHGMPEFLKIVFPEKDAGKPAAVKP
jgi:hypothetical protein